MKRTNLIIYSLIKNADFKNKWDSLLDSYEKYFNMEHNYIPSSSVLTDIVSKNVIDILFVEEAFLSEIEIQYLAKIRGRNTHFSYVIIKDKFEENDFEIYKKMVDNILYMNRSDKIIKWQTIALMRRYWNTFSKPTTIIYKNIIADFINNKVIYQGNVIDFTNKEIRILRLFIENIGTYFKRDDIFKKIWGYDTGDNTRAVDQIIHKIKKKIGTSYFTTKRNEGVKFE